MKNAKKVKKVSDLHLDVNARAWCCACIVPVFDIRKLVWFTGTTKKSPMSLCGRCGKWYDLEHGQVPQ